MADEALMDAPVVSQVNPNTVITPSPSTLQTAPVQPAATPAPEKPLFNTMADKLTELLKQTQASKQPAKEAPKEPVKESTAETPKPEASKATPEPEEKYTSKRAEEWKALKAQRDEWKTKAAKLEEEKKAIESNLETLKKAPVFDPKEFDAIKAERDELDKKLSMVALERNPKFSNHFKKLFDSAINAAKDSVPDATDKETVENLINMKPSKHRKEQFAAIMEKIENEFDKVNLATAIQQMDRARSEYDEEISNAKDRLSKIEMVEASNRTKQTELEKSSRMEKVNKVLSMTEEFDAFTEIEGQDEYNNQIPQRRERVKKALLGELPENEMLLMPMMAVEGEHLRTNVIPKMIAKMKEMETTIAQLQGAQPNMGGGTTTTQERGAGADNQNGFISTFQKIYHGPQRKR